jgi:hypothetical protein
MAILAIRRSAHGAASAELTLDPACPRACVPERADPEPVFEGPVSRVLGDREDVRYYASPTTPFGRREGLG